MSVVSFFLSLFAKKTVDSIISDISTKVEQLHVVAAAKAEAEQIHLAEITLRNKLVAEARAEWTRAKSIAAKFEALIS